MHVPPPQIWTASSSTADSLMDNTTYENKIFQSARLLSKSFDVPRLLVYVPIGYACMHQKLHLARLCQSQPIAVSLHSHLPKAYMVPNLFYYALYAALLSIICYWI